MMDMSAAPYGRAGADYVHGHLWFLGLAKGRGQGSSRLGINVKHYLQGLQSNMKMIL